MRQASGVFGWQKPLGQGDRPGIEIFSRSIHVGEELKRCIWFRPWKGWKLYRGMRKVNWALALVCLALSGCSDGERKVHLAKIDPEMSRLKVDFDKWSTNTSSDAFIQTVPGGGVVAVSRCTLVESTDGTLMIKDNRVYAKPGTLYVYPKGNLVSSYSEAWQLFLIKRDEQITLNRSR